MKKGLSYVACLLSLLLLTSCTGEDQVKLDIYQYLNTDVKPVIELQNTAVHEYNRYMNTEDIQPEQLISSLNQEVLPSLRQAEESLSVLTYQSEEVNAFVKQFQNVVTEGIEALEAVLSAVTEKDKEALAAANEKIDSAMASLEKYENDVRIFAASYDITIIEQENSFDDGSAPSGTNPHQQTEE